MFAVIKTGGKQYRVAQNDILQIERVAGEAGEVVEFPEVLMVGSGADATIGTPKVDGAMVTAEILEQFRDRKVISFKKRRRQNSKRIRGHRQMLTRIRISEILTGGAKPSRKAATKKPATAETAAKTEAPAEKPAKAARAEKVETAAIVDDISLIGGVGPALKKKLEAAGITSLKQIAEMDADGLARLDDDLKLGGRTARDEWAEQARELLAGKPPRAKVDRKAAEDDK